MEFTFNKYLGESTATELHESTLTKLADKMKTSRCAILTAFTNEDSKRINRANSSKLASALKELGYSYTQIMSTYNELSDDKELPIKELAFFIQCKEGEKILDFDRNLQLLAKKFNQSGVTIIPQGGRNAFILITKEGELGKYGDKIKIGGTNFGTITSNAYSTVNGKDFEFKMINEQDLKCQFKDEKLTSYIGKKVIKEMNDECEKESKK